MIFLAEHLRLVFRENLENGVLVLILDPTARVVDNNDQFRVLVIEPELDIYPLAFEGAVNGVLNNVVGHLLEPAWVANQILGQVPVLDRVLQILVQKEVRLQIIFLLLGTFKQRILLQVDSVREFILSLEVEFNVESYILEPGFHFEALDDVFELFLEVEADLLLDEGAILQGGPVLHVFEPEHDLLASDNDSHELRPEITAPGLKLLENLHLLA